MSSQLKTFLKTTIFFTVGFAVLYLVYLRQDKAYQKQCELDGIAAQDCSLLEKLATDIASADLFYIFIIVICFMVSNISRAMRWQQLIEPLGKTPGILNSFGAVMAGYLTNLGIPRSGEFVRAGLLAKYEDLPAEKVMGTIVTDRVMDVLCLLIAMGLAFLLSFKLMYGYFEENFDLSAKLGMVYNNPFYILLFGLALVILAWLLWKYRGLIINNPLGQKVVNLFKGFLEGIKSILKLKNPGLFIFHTVVIWAMYFLMTYIGFKSFAPTAHLPAVAGLVIFVFGTLGIVFPSPGGMGSYHFLVSEGLALYQINPADAFSFANILFFSVAIFCNVFFGIIAFIYLPIINRSHGESVPA